MPTIRSVFRTYASILTIGLLLTCNAFAQQNTQPAKPEPIKPEQNEPKDLGDLSLEDLMKIKVQFESALEELREALLEFGRAYAL